MVEAESLFAQLEEKTERLHEIFRSYPYIASAYVFGSQLRGRVTPMSDLDIAVLLKESHPAGRGLIHEMAYLSYRIEECLDLKVKADVVELNSQGVIFQHNVLRTGRLIYDADPEYRIRF